jgi:hypothetical protein
MFTITFGAGARCGFGSTKIMRVRLGVRKLTSTHKIFLCWLNHYRFLQLLKLLGQGSHFTLIKICCVFVYGQWKEDVFFNN